MTTRPHVLISGAGIGGLCLAQGLLRAGIPFTVFERDESPAARTQGYRIHISPLGTRSLKACLPDRLFELLCETSGEFSQGFTMISEQMGELLQLVPPADAPPQNPLEAHRSVSRRTLRRILMSGVRQNIRFGNRVAGFQALDNGRVEVRLEDGSAVAGDLLVGADGVNSAVRKQLLPGADPVDTGVVALGGKIPLGPGVMALMPPQLLDGPVMVMPKSPCSLFLAVWRRSLDKTNLLNEALSAETPEEPAEEEADYLIFGFGAKERFFGWPGDIRDIEGEDSLAILRRVVASWHPNLRMLTELVDPASLGATRIRTSPPIPEWQPGRVTLLGDAIHSMTPYRGIGGNVALRDAELLSRRLAQCSDPLEAITAYESEMRLYAPRAVNSSLEMCERMVADKSAGFAVMKGVLRAVNALPAVKQKVLTRMNDN